MNEIDFLVEAIRLSDRGAIRLDPQTWSRLGTELTARGVTYDESNQLAYEVTS